MKAKFSPKFYRQYNNLKSASYVIMKVTCSDARLLYSTGFAVTQADWSTAKQYPKDRVHLIEVADHINKLKEWVKEFAKGQTEVLRDDLRSYLEVKEGKKTIREAEENSEFFSAVDHMIDRAETGLLRQDNEERFSPSTIKNWRASKNRLKDFKPSLSFSHNDEKIYNEFKAWARSKDMGKSYLDKLIKDWRSFFKYCGYPVPPFKRLGVEEPDKPYLDANEIALLETVELTGTDDEIRDRYLVDLFTGLRISDMKNLDETRIVNKDTITFADTQKTGAPVAIPISSRIKQILDKYNGQFPPQHHEVVINRRIKVICGLARINSKVELVVADISKRLKTRLINEAFMDGSETTVWIPKNELITNHTARRSMATNMLRAGIPMNRARKITGMSLKTLMRYDKSTPMENANDVREHAYFA